MRKFSDVEFDVSDAPPSRRTVAITGAGGLLGSALALAFLNLGDRVVLIDNQSEGLSRVQGAVQSRFESSCRSLLADIAVQDEASRCIDYVTSCFGSIDVLINNAASRSRSPRDFFAPDEEYLDTTWRDVMATNLDGAFFMCQAAGRWMLEQKSGCIVNISSIYGVVGADQRIYAGSEQFGANMGLPAVYAASKAGILGLTRHLAAAWGPQGVRVNAVSPGGIENGQNEVFTRAFINRVPLGRMASTDDAVSATTFLSSDSASYINGHNLIVDGGLTIW